VLRVRGTSLTTPTATTAHYTAPSAAFVLEEKPSKTWICCDDAGVTRHAWLETSRSS
jgi:hypothetical protein